QRDMKNGATGMVVRHPDVTAMGLDDRLANGQSYSCSGRFRRKDRLQNALLVLRIYSRSGIFDGDQDTGVLLNEIRFDPQQADPVANGSHRFDGIHEQIQENLLQLRSIREELRKSLTQ